MDEAPSHPLAAVGARLAALLRPAFSLDLRSLALFRILLGLTHLGVALARLADAEALYSDAGALPRALAHKYVNLPWSSQLHFLSGAAGFERAMFLAHALAALALILGWKTRWATILCWGFSLGERERNLLASDGGDDFLVLACFFGAFLPLGARASLDARRAGPPPAGSTIGAGSVGFVLQLVCVYFFSVLLKSGRTWRIDHTALWYALALDSFNTPLAVALRAHPTLCKLLTRGTLDLELWGPLLVLFWPWKRWVMRAGVAFGFIALHLGILACLRIPHFSLAAVALWTAMLPGQLWDRLAPRTAGEVPLARPSGVSHAAWESVVVLGTVLMISANLASLPGSTPPPPVVRALAQMLGITQGWWMFSADPLTADGWYVFDAQLADGRHVDLRTGAAPSLARPEDMANTYPDVSWRNHLVNIHSHAEGEAFFEPLAGYLCRTWNASHPGSDRATSLDIIFMLEETQPDDPAPPATRKLLRHGPCP